MLWYLCCRDVNSSSKTVISMFVSSNPAPLYLHAVIVCILFSPNEPLACIFLSGTRSSGHWIPIFSSFRLSLQVSLFFVIFPESLRPHIYSFQRNLHSAPAAYSQINSAPKTTSSPLWLSSLKKYLTSFLPFLFRFLIPFFALLSFWASKRPALAGYSSSP